MQIYLENPNRIYIGGTFFGKNDQKWNFSFNSISDMDTSSSLLFKYPSSKYFGQFNEQGPFVNLKEKYEEIDANKKKYKKLTNQELKKQALDIVCQIREFLFAAELERIRSTLEQQIKLSQLKNDADKNRLFEENHEEENQRGRSLDTEYDDLFSVKSLVIRDELVSRVSDFVSGINTPPIEYELPGYHYKKSVADDLEFLAKAFEIGPKINE